MDKEVTIYSTPTCHFCQAAKDFFEENKVEYKEHNVAEDTERREEMIRKSGQMGVPVITVGDKLIVGYDESQLQEALGL